MSDSADTARAQTGLSVRGVVSPLVTPLDEFGDVDRRSLERLIRFQLGAGVAGIFLGGSSGEIALLDTAQRRSLVEVAVGVVGGAVPILMGAIDTGTRRVIEQARQATALGADAVVVTAPFYVVPHPEEILTHFHRVKAAIEVPIVAYDIPRSVPARLTPPIVAELAAAETIVGMKDSSNDLAAFREILRTTALPLFTGSEVWADTAIGLGAAGIVPGLGNVDPHGYVRLYRAAAGGDVKTARAEQERLAALQRIVSIADRGRIGPTAGRLGALKAALAARGIIDTPATTVPLAPLDTAETEAVTGALQRCGLAPIRHETRPAVRNTANA